jgi:hypothetical protein
MRRPVMCYSSSKDFGYGVRKEADRQPEAKQETPVETPEKPVKAQDFTFWAFPNWRRTPAPRTPSGERSKERV